MADDMDDINDMEDTGEMEETLESRQPSAKSRSQSRLSARKENEFNITLSLSYSKLLKHFHFIL